MNRVWFVVWYLHLWQTSLFSGGSWGRLESSANKSERSAPAIYYQIETSSLCNKNCTIARDDAIAHALSKISPGNNRVTFLRWKLLGGGVTSCQVVYFFNTGSLSATTQLTALVWKRTSSFGAFNQKVQVRTSAWYESCRRSLRYQRDTGRSRIKRKTIKLSRPTRSISFGKTFQVDTQSLSHRFVVISTIQQSYTRHNVYLREPSTPSTGDSILQHRSQLFYHLYRRPSRLDRSECRAGAPRFFSKPYNAIHQRNFSDGESCCRHKMLQSVQCTDHPAPV